MTCAVVVVAGGRGRRFGGDKLSAPLDAAGSGPSLLQALLDGVLSLAPGICLQLPLVVVGPTRPGLDRGAGGDGAVDNTAHVRFTQEVPAGSGPAAAVAAGVSAAPSADVLVVLPGDAPFVASAVPRLVEALGTSGADAVVGVDPSGRRQHLVLALRPEALDPGSLGPGNRAGRPARSLVDGLAVAEVPLTAAESLDVDEPADLEHVRRVVRP